MTWLAALNRHDSQATPCVVVTLLSVRGSVPREAGAKMVVSADTQDGSIGGGRLEYECADLARNLLVEPPEGPVTRDFPLGPALGQCCGGHVTVLFETITPPPLVALFGAGHVGRALVRFLGELPVRVRWIDDRGAFPDVLPGNVVSSGDPLGAVADLPPGAIVLVMTHDHALDFRIVAACLRRGDPRFVGLIGSGTKRARFARRLRDEGLSDAALICPIGLPGVGGKLPGEIALSVAAQVMRVRSDAAGTLTPTLSRERERGRCRTVVATSPPRPLAGEGRGEGAATCADCRECAP